MNTRIIKALREFECELSTICYDYFCKDALTTREYHDKKDSAMRRCKLKIEVALECELEDDQESKTLMDCLTKQLAEVYDK